MARPKKNLIPKTKPRIRLRKNKPEQTFRAERRAAQKVTFLEFAKTTCGNIDQAVALYNQAADGHDHISAQTIYGWAKDDPKFSAAMADCRHLIAANLGKLAVQSLTVGMQRANPQATKLALDYYVMPERAAAQNSPVAVQVNVSLADALRKADPERVNLTNAADADTQKPLEIVQNTNPKTEIVAKTARKTANLRSILAEEG